MNTQTNVLACAVILLGVLIAVLARSFERYAQKQNKARQDMMHILGLQQQTMRLMIQNDITFADALGRLLKDLEIAGAMRHTDLSLHTEKNPVIAEYLEERLEQ